MVLHDKQQQEQKYYMIKKKKKQGLFWGLESEYHDLTSASLLTAGSLRKTEWFAGQQTVTKSLPRKSMALTVFWGQSFFSN